MRTEYDEDPEDEDGEGCFGCIIGAAAIWALFFAALLAVS